MLSDFAIATSMLNVEANVWLTPSACTDSLQALLTPDLDQKTKHPASKQIRSATQNT
jgi:hypothetical protein